MKGSCFLVVFLDLNKNLSVEKTVEKKKMLYNIYHIIAI